MMIIKTLSHFFISILFIQFLSCSSGGSSSDGSSNINIGNVDIFGAKALMVTSTSSNFKASNISNSQYRSANTSQVFVKFKNDGTHEEIAVEDDNGNPVDAIPDEIYDCEGDYVIIVFDSHPYLVNKITGSAYDLEPVGIPNMGTNSGYRSTKRIYTDNDGNIYYCNSGRVKKIDISNPNRITAENYTIDLDTVYEFAVDLNGNVLYSRNGSYGWNEPCRIKKANGGLYNTGSEYKGFFTGLDGNLYCNRQLVNDGTTPANTIYKVNIDSSYNVSFEQYGDTGSTVTDWGHILYFSDRILNVNCQTRYIHEVYTTAGSPRASYQQTALLNGISVKQSNNFFYVLKSGGAILKFNPVDYSYTTLINDGAYEMYMLDVTNDNIVIFNALRLADGKKVIGQILNNGTINIIDDTLTEEVLILKKVN